MSVENLISQLRDAAKFTLSDTLYSQAADRLEELAEKDKEIEAAKHDIERQIKVLVEQSDEITALEARCRELEEERDEWRDRSHRHLELYGDADGDLHTAQAHAQQLTEALRPFAADYAGRSQLAPGPDIDHWPIGGSSLTYGHLRRASEALSLTPTSALAAVRDVVREIDWQHLCDVINASNRVSVRTGNEFVIDAEKLRDFALTAIRARKGTGE